MDLLQVLLKKEIIKIDSMNTRKQILKNVVVSFNELSLRVILVLNFLWLLLTPFLRDSGSGSPVFMQVDNFLTRWRLVTSPRLY